MDKNTTEYLLDSPPGTLVWLSRFQLGDTEQVYPVKFLGFVDGQTECKTVIVTNPWDNGYSDRTQDTEYKFRRALYLAEVNVYDLRTTIQEAYRSIILGLRSSGLTWPVVAGFLNLYEELYDDICTRDPHTHCEDLSELLEVAASKNRMRELAADPKFVSMNTKGVLELQELLDRTLHQLQEERENREYAEDQVYRLHKDKCWNESTGMFKGACPVCLDKDERGRLESIDI